MGEQLDCALDLMRRLPPGQVEDNLAGLLDLVPHLTEELLADVDQPLKVAHDPVSRRDYLLCDYNRDSDSYRSPWSNKYDPPLDDGTVPSDKLREFEIKANNVFDVYRDLYFEGGVSSVYCWDLDHGGFACCILIKKTQDHSKKGQPMKGTWDSIHVMEVQDMQEKALYKLTSTVMLYLETETNTTGQVSLAGSLTRQDQKELKIDKVNNHIVNIGKMVEDMEIKARSELQSIYFGKTKDVVSQLRSMMPKNQMNAQSAVAAQMAAKLAARNKN